MKSIENDREIRLGSKNPFETERALYQKKEFIAGDIPITVAVPDFYQVAFPKGLVKTRADFSLIL